MYTPHALFSRLFLKICFFVLSLYTVGRLMTLPCEIYYRLETERKVCMVCAHKYCESDNALLKYGHLKFSKMAACCHLGFDPTGNGAVRSAVPENPALEPNTKSIGWRVAEIWPPYSCTLCMIPPTPICCRFLGSTQPLRGHGSASLSPQHGTHSLLAFVFVLHHTHFVV